MQFVKEINKKKIFEIIIAIISIPVIVKVLYFINILEYIYFICTKIYNKDFDNK